MAKLFPNFRNDNHDSVAQLALSMILTSHMRYGCYYMTLIRERNLEHSNGIWSMKFQTHQLHNINDIPLPISPYQFVLANFPLINQYFITIFIMILHE